MNTGTEAAQRDICRKYGAEFTVCRDELKLGVSLSLKEGVRPIHGMRVNPTQGTSGWYVWAGEYSESADFFKPLHAGHIADWEPLVRPYLGLPPGWRFLIAENYEDVWYDDGLAL